MTSELLALIATHFACADIADQRMMNVDEVRTCGAVYQQIKIAFVPGVDARDFAQLSLQERVAVNKAGFLAFLDWRRAHPEMVRHLESVARGEVELSRAG
ncbi:MAG: hypothetical protein RIE24_06035 [Silicimonas sp.]